MSRLFDPGPASANLTVRQQFVYDELVRLTRDGQGADADEIGARLHARRDKHPAEKRCNWCAADGQGALEELRAKKLAKQKRYVGWVPLLAPPPDQEDDPFPDGY